MSDIFLIKEAATRIYNIKAASVGYENGYLWDLGQHAENHLPEVLKPIARHPLRTAAAVAAVPAFFWAKGQYKKWKADREAKKRSLPKQVPVDVMVGTPENQIPEDVLAKESSYNKVNKVLNWIYS